MTNEAFGRCAAVYVVIVRDRITALREELGLTQVQIAKAVGWTQERQATIEAGRHRLSRAVAGRLASALSALSGTVVTVEHFSLPVPKDCVRVKQS